MSVRFCSNSTRLPLPSYFSPSLFLLRVVDECLYSPVASKNLHGVVYYCAFTILLFLYLPCKFCSSMRVEFSLRIRRDRKFPVTNTESNGASIIYIISDSQSPEVVQVGTLVV